MSNVDILPGHAGQTKQVWTPLKKPPHPGSVHTLSDDAILVLAALREAHSKKIDEQQRRCKKSTDARSYYTRIYTQSFKTEKVDTAPEDRSILISTKMPPAPGASQVDTFQQSGEPTNFDFGSSWTNPTLPVELVSVVKTEPEEESLSCSKTHNPTDRVDDENLIQLCRLPDQVQRKYEISKAHQQETKVNDCTGPSKSCACSPRQKSCALSHLPSVARSLPSGIGDTSKGSRTSSRTHPPWFSRSSSAEDVKELEGQVTSPLSRTVPSLQNMIGSTSESTTHVRSEIISRANHHQVSRSSLSPEDAEELDDHAIPVPSISKTVLSLQNVTGSAGSRLIRQGSRTFSRMCPIPVSMCTPSAEDVEGLSEHKTLCDRPVGLSIPSRIDTNNTVNVCPEEMMNLKPSEAGKSLQVKPSSVSTESSALDVKQLSTNAGSVGSNQDLETSKPCKRKNPSMSSKFSNNTPAAKKRIIPTFHNKVSGLKVKSKSKPETLSQMSIEQVMGTNSSLGPPLAVKSITSVSPTELTNLQEAILDAGEILMMLMYTDGSTQLREVDKPRKRVSAALHEDGVANSLLVAIQHRAAGKEYIFVSFPMAGLGKENHSEKTRNVLLEILKSRTRKVCFDAQEMMHAIIINCRLDPQTGCNRWVFMDPKIACWLLYPDNPPITFSEMLKTFFAGKYRLTTNNPLEDLKLLGPVMEGLTNRLQRKGLWELYINLEVPLIPILAGMEVQGIQINEKMLISYSNILKDAIREVERQCYKEAGHPFQITSHIQLRQVLFDELKLDEQCPGQKLARTNVQNLKSTSETVLHKLKGLHPLPELVLNHRQLVKLKSTYIDGLSDYVSGGYIHTSWEQTSAASGRLQSANPNIQNIPKQPLHLHEETKGLMADECNASTAGPEATTLWMREQFFSHDGWSFIAADFQSIELRILAHLSQDAMLLKVFNDSGSTDIFVQLTCEWLGLNPEDVKTAERERTKRIVYSVIYGVGAERLAETLNDTKENAKAFTKSFLGKFKGVNTFTHRCISECQRHGRVMTIFNRHRLISNINSQNFHVRSHAERQAVNFMIQGSAADICKLAMIRIMKVLSDNTLRARLLVQIHDELLFEVHDKDVDEVKGLLKNVMESTPILGENICQLKVPLPVSLSYGKTWGHLKQI